MSTDDCALVVVRMFGAPTIAAPEVQQFGPHVAKRLVSDRPRQNAGPQANGYDEAADADCVERGGHDFVGLASSLAHPTGGARCDDVRLCVAVGKFNERYCCAAISFSRGLFAPGQAPNNTTTLPFRGSK